MAHGGTLINFPGQESNEQIYIFTRRHPAAFLPVLATIFLMAVLGMAVLFILNNFLSYNFVLLMGSAYLLFILLFTIVEFFDFYFDLYIATDRRIVDIDQNKFFNRTVAELLYEDIQDVGTSVKGILPTIFDYGDVVIQTAGARPNFSFDQVGRPKEIAAIILDISDQQTRGVAEADRHPEGPVAAVVNGQLLPHTADHQNEI